ncbi:MAG TPA: [protein-PII] uridylyltransferase [Opitutaceae bacterium]|nr:[protein-PII] uridylyltransferase [Opitutaceae bacterium]
MAGRIHLHARERLNFQGEVPVAARLAACKTFLRLESGLIRMHHDAGEAGLKIVQARAAMIDVMLGCLFDYALDAYRRARGEPPSPVCLIALGGYGRHELSPQSDIDVMFLFPSKAKPAVVKPLQEHLVNEVLYILWDCDLKVGHSTRTIDEVFVEARKNIETKTSLLESHLIAGQASLYETFAKAYRNFATTEDPKGYIADRLADQATRRAKYGDTVFLQEPDIKNGVGGLRDYQNTLWMARVKLGIERMEELHTLHYLRRKELADFQRAYNFLLRVRNELHFISKRPTDIIDLEMQPRVAHHLGYRQHDILQRVEDFMEDYYRHAQAIYRISKIVENRLALSLREGAGSLLSLRDVLRLRRSQRTKQIDGFVLRGQELGALTPAVFAEDPARLIRVFRHCQQLGAAPDFNLAALVRESLPLMTRRVLESPDANISFLSILDEAGSVYPTLQLMHELGVLGRFIPAFDRLTCLVQHEFYHRYTADIHTLNAIRELDRVFTEAEPITLKYRRELHETSAPTLLYLILLLHDIGKAMGIKDHSENGVRIAGPLLERLQVDARNRELVTFIIKNHLIMARFWQRHNVDDPQSAMAFAELVGDAEKLRYLYVHTFCDARGTAASLWNGYKDTLHTTLFLATLDRLVLGDAVEKRNRERKQMIHQELIAKQIPGISADEVSAHFNLLPERYFLHTEADEITLHIQMVNRLLKSITQADSVSSLRPIVEWKDDLNRSLTIVNVVTWDRAGLFYKLAGGFSVAGLNILGAKVITRTDHIAIDTFYVVEPGRGVVQSQPAMETFARTVEAALIQNKDLYPEIVAQAKKIASSRYTTASTALHTAFPPTVEVYHELTMQRTIIDIQAHDQIGLLYRVAKTIYDHGFDITFARINTERGVALDTFYIESADHQPIEGTGRLHTLRDALAGVIKPPAAEPPPAG